MILRVDELRRYIQSDAEDFVLEGWLKALETAIKGYTNNNFIRVLEQNGGEYPMDIKMGVVNLIKWDMNRRDNLGVTYEAISRHSVSYGDVNARDSTTMGYPWAMVAFLKPYMRARFGRGVGV